MGKGGNRSSKPTRSLKTIRASMPFHANKTEPVKSLPRTMGGKQRSMILHGLKHLGAPVDTCLH